MNATHNATLSEVRDAHRHYPIRSSQEATSARVFLTRGLAAILWAAVFAAAADSVTTAVPVGVGVLLVLYPLIDVAGSVFDARTQRGSARKRLLGNALTSTVAAAGPRRGRDRRRDRRPRRLRRLGRGQRRGAGWPSPCVAVPSFGSQWPLLLAGSFSVLAGVAYIMLAGSADPGLARSCSTRRPAVSSSLCRRTCSRAAVAT